MNRIVGTLARSLVCALLVWPLLASPAIPAGATPTGRSGSLQTAVLAGGCFWGMEAVFSSLRGVSDVTSGYAGGNEDTAQYERVSTGLTGHAEAVKISFDPARISYKTLLAVYFSVAHDPTELNRQGPDEGTQYRSVIFYAGERQKREARAAIVALTNAKAYATPIVTQVVPLRAFYAAEAYHQHFAERNPDYPYIVEVDAPKLVALRARFPSLVKER